MAKWPILLWTGLLVTGVTAVDVLYSSGYATCQTGGDFEIDTLEASFDRSTLLFTFDISGSSKVSQNISALLTVSAYGEQVYQNQFYPCDYSIAELCPIPATSFSAAGNQTVPQEYADQIPSIAYTVPDLDGLIKLQIFTASTNESIGCIEASVTNGKTTKVAAVEYVGAGVAAVALVSSGLAALMSGAHAGSTGTSSPSFAETMGWFQAMAMNGMLSVNYPSVYRSFSSNFGFSTGLVTWPSLQQTIDSFRSSTGGNLTDDSYDYLQNTTLIYTDSTDNDTVSKRDMSVFARGITYSVSSSASTDSSSSSSSETYVSGIAAYSEQLSIPQGNTFMTLLLIFALVVGVIIIWILLLKLILEIWALMHPLPKSLESWRRRYWGRLVKAVTALVVIFYGIWTMYSIYQFTDGDSWAAKLLAGLSLGLFTTLIAGFTIRIMYKARQLKRQEGHVNKLYEDKETWITYSQFYDSFKRTYWWIFIPLLIASFARGAIIAGANGYGLIQTIGQIAVDVVLLLLLLWARPYASRSGNVINIVIQIVRVLSVACLLIFVEELGISQTAQTLTGLALIIVQAVLTGLLAILIIVNLFLSCCRTNPEKHRRRQAEKQNRECFHSAAQPDAQESLLMRDVGTKEPTVPFISAALFSSQRGGYGVVPGREHSPPALHSTWPNDVGYHSRSTSHDQLLPNAAGIGRERSNSRAQPHGRHVSFYEPTNHS